MLRKQIVTEHLLAKPGGEELYLNTTMQKRKVRLGGEGTTSK